MTFEEFVGGQMQPLLPFAEVLWASAVLPRTSCRNAADQPHWTPDGGTSR